MNPPRISVVTPSFQQAAHLGQALASVLDQGYPDLQYLVLDGGSSDGSADLIAAQAGRLHYWHSRRDRGQSDALNQGFARADGDILGWVNSDDYLLPGSLAAIARAFQADPDAVAWVGTCRNVDISGHPVDDTVPAVGDALAFARWGMPGGARLGQPACFFSRAAFRKAGPLREDLHFVFDVDLWIRLARLGRFRTIDAVLAANRMYPETKTNRDPFAREIEHLGMLLGHGFREVAQERFPVACTGILPGRPDLDRCLDQVPARRLAGALAAKMRRRIAASKILCHIRTVVHRHRQRRAQKQMERLTRTILRTTRNRCWCGGVLSPYARHASYQRCVQCGSYVNIRPPRADQFAKIYSFKHYWQTQQIAKDHPTITERSLNDRHDGRVAFWLGLIAEHAPQKGMAVEIGCAHGVLLSALRDAGWQTCGVEPDPQTAAWTQKTTGLDVRAGFFPGPALPACQLFLAMDVMEHVLNPQDFLSAAAGILAPGGIAIIQTPIVRDRSDPPFGELFAKAFDDLEHLVIFTNPALQILAVRCGLNLVRDDLAWAQHHEVVILRKADSP